MAFMEDFLSKNEDLWRRERACLPMARLRPAMDGALLVPGCRVPGYAFWRALPFEGAPEGVSGWAAARGVALHPAVAEYLSAWRRYEIWFRFERRLFQAPPVTLSQPPLRALSESRYAWEHASGRPFSVTVAATADDGEPLVLAADAATAKVALVRLYTDEALMRTLWTLDRFLQGARLEVPK